MAYRPDPEKRPSRFPPPERKEEEEAEEVGPREMPGGGVSLRRRGADLPSASPWRGSFDPSSRVPSRSTYEREPEVEELEDILFPKEWRGGEAFHFADPFDVLPGRVYIPSPRQPPRQPAQQRPGAAPTGGGRPSRPTRAREGPPSVDPMNWFDMPKIWAAVAERRVDPRFQRGTPVGIVQVAPPRPDEMARAADLIRFFRIPRQEVERYQGRQLWDALLHPFMDELSYAMNQAKPSGIPGDLGFQAGRDGSFWLGYAE